MVGVGEEQALVGLPNGSVLGHFYINLELLRLGEIVWFYYILIQDKPNS